MRVSPVDLDSCGPCNIQPFFNRLRPDEPSLYEEVNSKDTLYDSIDGRSTLYDNINGKPPAHTDPAKMLLHQFSLINPP